MMTKRIDFIPDLGEPALFGGLIEITIGSKFHGNICQVPTEDCILSGDVGSAHDASQDDILCFSAKGCFLASPSTRYW